MFTRYAFRMVQTRSGPMAVGGEDVTTDDGQVWFHSYGGHAPIRVR